MAPLERTSLVSQQHLYFSHFGRGKRRELEHDMKTTNFPCTERETACRARSTLTHQTNTFIQRTDCRRKLLKLVVKMLSPAGRQCQPPLPTLAS
jgi:hypothetical protein